MSPRTAGPAWKEVSMAFSLRCQVFGHTYGPALRSEEDARYWVCKWCGSKRYTPPTDVPVLGDG